MGKIFHIYASQGRHNYVERDLPASDHEMLDLMERLRYRLEVPSSRVLRNRDPPTLDQQPAGVTMQ